MKNIVKTYSEELYFDFTWKDLQTKVEAFAEFHKIEDKDKIYFDEQRSSDYYDDSTYSHFLKYDVYETDEEYAERIEKEKQNLIASRKAARQTKEEKDRKEYERLKLKFEKGKT